LPDLAQTIKSLPVEAFSALVRSIGLEDAGEIVALATTDQLVQAFDEDLFVSEKSGERERFDVKRFALWLEVLLEAGEELTADRISELDESFVAHALSGLILVLEEDALRERLDESGERQGRLVDKAIENALLEEIDGYLLVAQQQQGWDSVLALVLSLDRNHRPLLVRLLDRLVRIGSHLLDDLDELSTVLSEGESLAEDVEAAREERRSRQGYVEPRAARAFLLLARRPMDISDRRGERDPLTKAYFRELMRFSSPGGSAPTQAASAFLPSVDPPRLAQATDASFVNDASDLTAMGVFVRSLRELNDTQASVFSERMDEFAYLVNVLVAGFDEEGERLSRKKSVRAALATVCFGAVLAYRASQSPRNAGALPTQADYLKIIRKWSADWLFRLASSALSSGAAPDVKGAKKRGFLMSGRQLDKALDTATPSSSTPLKTSSS